MQPVIFFDGICNLCNASVQFAIKHDKKKVFKFSALQGDYAKEILPNFGVRSNEINSIVLISDNCLYTKSSAALRVAKKLDGVWPILWVLLVIPKFVRDWFYDIIAMNRYRWWGKQESCWLPTPDLKERFLP
ncbi:thiol-disulfide oxidoreductase DCC family protein [Pedobacter sandarakinus]|uniref:thiol-disulfide oxidoreductase DCC family protein n=1 Tax=Pedobacter sandarakinus TaxID=353156 RepID=UPI0022463788|nr:DCC1-like thiol-disulfide oxidoreductase family protein [Pedobacter sandarakinus]MCX2574603.1 DCC1-like thiol-disulfide oxidoreductase family protein [Pedobacter sandarakinus]